MGERPAAAILRPIDYRSAPQESAGINWEPSTEDYRKFYESGPFSYADFGSATITVHAQFQGGKEVEKHLFVYFSEDGYQTYKLLD